MTHPPPSSPRGGQVWRWAVIGGTVAAAAAAFGYTAGWLAPHRLTPQRIVAALQANGGLHPGFRRNHAKGICVTGYFESNGDGAAWSSAPFFGAGVRTPVVGRFALPGGNPYAPDTSVPIRSLALRLTAPDGEQWRTGMNAMPVFPVATPRAFYEQTVATRPDPATGKPYPKKVGAFFAAHPETAAFRAWVKTAKPSASFATETYYGINAFYFVDAQGMKHAVRWRVVPEQTDGAGVASGANVLQADLAERLGSGPQRWHWLVTFANPGDPVNDATRNWPADRKTLDIGTLVLDRAEAQDSGPCRDINYDPTVLPTGIEPSGDPLLAARSAAYADSYKLRTSEEAGVPGYARAAPEAR
ncbi:catalase family peroxidase [Burkholderia glumae]|uniref:catalase family peroxidase n=1 Tax=Burkholderia glumae TaxID=337 RepID=UPI002151598A|nr:catalase family peroxidase [Burkholderia glumae]